MRFEDGALIRNIDTRQLMMVVGYVGNSIMIVDPRCPDGYAQALVILDRDRDKWMLDTNWECETKRDLPKMDYNLTFHLRRLSAYRI
jgi:hypothetical protein